MPGKISESEVVAIHTVMRVLGENLGLDFVVITVRRDGVACTIAACQDQYNDAANGMKDLMVEAVRKLGIPTASDADPEGKQN